MFKDFSSTINTLKSGEKNPIWFSRTIVFYSERGTNNLRFAPGSPISAYNPKNNQFQIKTRESEQTLWSKYKGFHRFFFFFWKLMMMKINTFITKVATFIIVNRVKCYTVFISYFKKIISVSLLCKVSTLKITVLI